MVLLLRDGREGKGRQRKEKERGIGEGEAREGEQFLTGSDSFKQFLKTVLFSLY